MMRIVREKIDFLLTMQKGVGPKDIYGVRYDSCKTVKYADGGYFARRFLQVKRFYVNDTGYTIETTVQTILFKIVDLLNRN